MLLSRPTLYLFGYMDFQISHTGDINKQFIINPTPRLFSPTRWFIRTWITFFYLFRLNA